MEGTEALRRAAPHWTLEGDQQLLNTLQELHQRIVNACEETDRRLGALGAALRGAGLTLRNVNNKFMALSNSQFIESRVYEDDVDVVTTATPVKETPSPPSVEAELANLRRGLAALERLHEAVTILPSDSDSDSDGEECDRVMVLKPKDVYVHRPLPHIIGSHAWRSKWHAGLVAEDSDSSTSSPEPARLEQYSESEAEGPDLRPAPENVSETSSERGSSQAGAEAGRPTPAAVAAALARRLGSQPHQIPEPPLEDSPPEPAVRKVYKPHQPAPGAIFPDEPPPLEPSDQSDDDIFAELHKSKPYVDSNKARIPVDLFGHTHYQSEEDDDIFNDIPDVAKKPTAQTNTSVKPKSTLFEDEPEPELFADKRPVQETVKRTDTDSKKPVGGISLFGTNKTSDSIGAAILKRNQQRSSTSGEESPTDDVDSKPQTKPLPQVIKKPELKKEKDIFDDLFAKSEKIQKKNLKKEQEEKKEVKTEKKVDLFSDNIFDDIDDIFSTNIVTKEPLKEPVKGGKSIFDDEDDLFADIATTKTTDAKTKNDQEIKTKNDNVRSIFDSDDDLFSEKTEKVKFPEKNRDNISEGTSINTNNYSAKVSEVNKVSEPKVKESKSLFDSDDDIFSDVKTKIAQEKPSVVVKPKITKNDLEVRLPENSVSQNVQETKNKNNIFADDDEDLFSNKTSREVKTTPSNVERINSDFIDQKSKPSVNKSPNLFDDDEDSDNIFTSSDKSAQNLKVKTEDIFENSTSPKVEKNLISTTKRDILVDPEIRADGSNKEENSTKFQTDVINEVPVVKDIPTIFKIPENNISNYEKADDFNSKVLNHKPDNEIIVSNEKEQIKDEKSNRDILEDDFEDNLFVKTNEKEQIKDEKSKRDILEDDFEDNLFVKTVENKKAESHKPVIAQKPIVHPKTEIKQELSKVEQNTEKIHETPNVGNNKEIAKDPAPKLEVKTDVIPELDNRKENKNDTENKIEQTDLNTPDLFADIFNDQPPEFQKPKEPKRSKNVNALFDDDSDDEALFFRKTDPTLDDKPADFSPKVSEDRLFGLFHDEPPAIDIDFEQKPDKVDILNDDFDDFLDRPKENKDTVDAFKETRLKEDITANAPLPELPKAKQETNVEPKKIGKLKPMNFNINVNTLLPGASPKKVQKSNEQTDGQASSKSNEELHTSITTTEETESKLVKSVSFEGDPESNILDNKLSKERPKIQVKRRPSTRRARREAVKKSGIDFGEDSTDNSSSIDDPPKDKNVKNDSVNKEKSINIDYNTEIIRDISEPLKVTDADNVDNSSNIEEKVQEPPQVTSTKIVYILNDEDIFSDMKPIPKVEENKPPVTKNKVLNIVDDDDDIFKSITTAKADNVEHKEPKDVQSIEPIVAISTLGEAYPEPVKKEQIPDDDDDDIFKGFSKTEPKTETEKTEEAAKHETVQATKPSKSKSSIFDDLSDEENELFNTKKTVKSKTIFNSDSEEELFAGKSKRETKKVEREEVVVKRETKQVVKGSLFGDEDDDDLFGVKAKVIEIVPQTKPAVREASSKPAEPVFEDPLSLLGGDDD